MGELNSVRMDVSKEPGPQGFHLEKILRINSQAPFLPKKNSTSLLDIIIIILLAYPSIGTGQRKPFLGHGEVIQVKPLVGAMEKPPP